MSNSNLNGSNIVSTNIEIKMKAVSKIPSLTSATITNSVIPTNPTLEAPLEDFVVTKQTDKENTNTTKSNIPTKAPPTLSSTNKTSTNKSLKLFGNNDNFAKQQIKTFTDWMNFTFYKSHLINEEDVDDEASVVSSSSAAPMNADDVTGAMTSDWKGIMDKQYENTIR
jgi:hypothetical protein